MIARTWTMLQGSAWTAIRGLVVLCCAAPLVWMIAWVIITPSAWSALTPAGFHLKLLGRTFLYNGLSAVIATGLAIPVAVVIGRGRGRWAGVLATMLPISLLLPSLVYAYGWMQVQRLAYVWWGNPHTDWVHAWDVTRCVWTLATWLWPIPAAVIGLALRRMDPDLQQQALLDGVMRRMTARQLLGPGLAALIVCTILAMQEYSIFEAANISVVPTEIRTVFETGLTSSPANAIAGVYPGQGQNVAAAFVVGVPLLLCILLLAWAARRVMRDDGGAVAEVSAIPRNLQASWWMHGLALAVVLVAVVTPLAALALSLKRTPDPGRVWRTFGPTVTGTLTITSMAAGIALLVSLAGTFRKSRWPLALGIMTFLVGGQLLAIALIHLCNRPGRPWQWLYNGPAIVVVAYLARFAWLGLLAARSTHGRGYRELRDMAAVDGASARQTAWRVVLPLAWPVLLAGGMLVWALSMTEVPATVLLHPLRPKMLIPELVQWVHRIRDDDMIEGSLLMVAMVTLLAALAMLLAWRGRRLLRGAGHAVAIVLLIGVGGCKDPRQPDAIWLETGVGQKQVVYPRAIACDRRDNSFYVVDRMARIQHLDAGGQFIREWRMPAFTNGKPVGLSVDHEGLLWVPDTHYHQVLVFNDQGELKLRFGTYGKRPGEFTYPSDIAFDNRGRVFVSEFGDNDRVQVFDRSGKFLYQFGKFGDGDGQFSRPQSMVIKDDILYITDACNHRISVWRTDGVFVRNMGRIGSALGELRYPYGLDMDDKGRLIVCEFGNNRVQLLDPQTGAGLATWGCGGREPGQLAYPWAVAVDGTHRVVAVDSGNNRLQLFWFSR